MKNTVILISFLLISMSGLTQTIVEPGNVYGIWEKVKSPYIINGDIKIPNDSNLIIEHGVLIEFTGEFEFKVEGVIQVAGENIDSVKFTSSKGIKWKGFVFNTSTYPRGNYLKYTVIENAQKEYGGGIYVNGYILLTIENCIIQNCAGRFGGGIYIFGDIWENVTVKNTIIRKNNSMGFGSGGGIYLDVCASKFIGCLIYDNYSKWNAAAINTLGHGYSPKFINCTICDNFTDNEDNKTINIGCDAIFENTIIYFNSPSGVFIESEFYKPEFRFCNISQEPKLTNDIKFPKFDGVFENNIVKVAPDFEDRSERNYKLAKSHCINKGNPDFKEINFNTDLLGNSRIFNETNKQIDIGALEYQNLKPNRTPALQSEKEYFLVNNSTTKIDFNYFDSDIEDIHSIYISNNNTLINASALKENEEKFILEINPLEKIITDEWFYIFIDDQTGTDNAILRDSILVHFSNHFKGVVSNLIELKDSVRIIGDILVKPEGKIVVAPGSFVQFDGDYEIDVFGEIEMTGDKQNPIIINAIDTGYYNYFSGATTYLRKNGWGGIILHNRQNIAFEYVEMKNTVEGAFRIFDSNNISFKGCSFYNCLAEWEGNGGICFENSNGSVDSCSFWYGTTGTSNTGTYISVKNSLIDIKNSFFNENLNYTDLYSDMSAISSLESEIKITGCYFENIQFIYCISVIAGTNTVIENNAFKYNVAGYIIEVISDYCMIRRNKFIKNNARCIWTRLTVLDVINNLFAYNTHYCGCVNYHAFVELTDSGIGDSAQVINNTFYGNRIDSPNGHAVFYRSATGKAYNNIFWNNTPKEIYWNNGVPADPPEPTIINNCIQGNYYKYGNFALDPRFVFSDSLDFQLSSESYYIDKGLTVTLGLLPESDLEGNPRINLSTNKVDFGAYEFYKTTNSHDLILLNDLRVFPNPVTEELKIVNSKIGDIKEVRIFSLTGELLILEYPNKKNVNMKIGWLKSGVYLLEVDINYLTLKNKIIKI